MTLYFTVHALNGKIECMGHGMKFFSVVIALVGISSFSNAEEKSSGGLNEQIEVLEQQAEFSCSSTADDADPVRLQTAEAVLKDESLASQLLQEVKERAKNANTVLEHAEEILINHHAKLLEKKSDEQQKKLDLALSKLDQSINNEDPEPVSEKLRENVRQEYKNFQTNRKPANANVLFKDELSALRKSKLQELNSLAAAGLRVGKAIKKTSICYCKMTTDTICKNKDELQAQADWFGAYSKRQAADKGAHAIQGNSAR